MQCDDLFTQRQTQARPFPLLELVGPNLEEASEEFALVIRRYAGPLVRDGHRDTY